MYADSRSLTTLLLIRDIQQQRTIKAAVQNRSENAKEAVIISEILDPRTKSLLQVGDVSDYVTSNELVNN